MTIKLRYKAIPFDEGKNMIQIVGTYSDDGYATLSQTDWRFEDIYDAIETFELIVSYLKKHKKEK